MAPTATASRPAKRSGSSASRRARWPRSASKPRNAANAAIASTATATTAISRAPRAARADYVGRFAPSPTGSLHLGSLVTAVGSFADARSRGGRWLLRMEDLDASRVIPGCAERTLRMLEAFGLTWDGAVEYQSARTHHYGEALATLEALGLTFQCSCTRAERNADGGYPGTCRNGPKRPGAARGPQAPQPGPSGHAQARATQPGARMGLRPLGTGPVPRRAGSPRRRPRRRLKRSLRKRARRVGFAAPLPTDVIWYVETAQH